MPNFDINSHFIKEANFSQVKFGEDGYVLEVELNEMQQIQREKLKQTTRETIGSYGIFCEGEYEFDGTSLRIKNERVLVDGEVITIEDAIIEGLKEGSKVYLQAWDKEVTYNDSLKKHGYENSENTVSNKIKDARIGVETSRRFVLSYTLSTSSNSSRLNLLIGEVKNGEFTSNLECVGSNRATHTSKDGSPIKVLNIGGSLLVKPQFSSYTGLKYNSEKVVQHGLVDASNYEFDLNTDDFSVLFNLKPSNLQETTTMLHVPDGFQIFYSSSTGNFRFGCYGETVIYTEIEKYETNKNYVFNVVKTKNKVVLNLNGKEYVFDISKMKGGTSKILIPNSMKNLYDLYRVYNIKFTRQEISHNLKVLSIQTSVLDSNILSAEIKGQTVKNYIIDRSYINATDFDATTQKSNFWSNKYEASLKAKYTSLQPNSKYTMIIEVFENTRTQNFSIQCGNPSFPDVYKYAYVTIFGGQTGTFRLDIETIDTIDGEKWAFFAKQPIEEGTKFVFRLTIVSRDDALKINLPENSKSIDTTFTGIGITGLTSTEAIISVEGNKYPIHEPTIKGKTMILKAPKGTQNWVEISQSEPRDITKFDYKLDSINGDLGSIINTVDYVDRERMIKIVKTGYDTLNGSENWQNSKTVGDTLIQFSLYHPNSAQDATVISDKFESIQASMPDKEAIAKLGTAIYVTILKSKLTTQDINGFKQWLQANPINIRHVLTKQQEIHLTNEELLAYDEHKKVISLGSVSGVFDTLEIKDDGSSIYKKSVVNEVLDGKRGYTINWFESEWDDIYAMFSLRGYPETRGNTNKVNCDSTTLPCVTRDAIRTMDMECICTTGLNNGSEGIILRIKKSSLETLDTYGVMNYLKSNPIQIIYQSNPSTTHISKELTQSIIISKTNCLVEVGIGSSVLPSKFSFIHYPSVKSVINELTMEQLITLGNITQPFHKFDYVETGLNVCHQGYMSGGFINIPFHLLDNTYVNRTNSVTMYDDLTLILVNSASKEITISKSTENISLVSMDGHNFILRIPTTEEGVGNVYVTSNTSIGLGLRGGK